MAQSLLIVDVQRCFINEFTRHVPQRIVRLIENDDYKPLLFTRFLNAPHSPYRRFLGWHECAEEPDTDIVPELASYADDDRIFSKPGLTGLPDDLIALLRQEQTEEMVLAGIDTDMCVLKIALDLFDLGIRPIVMTDCCASTAGLQAHLAGLAVLARNIGAQQLHEAGLGEGTIAAPVEENP